MGSLTDQEKTGLRDLLLSQKDRDLPRQLLKTLTKNMVAPSQTEAETLDALFVQSMTNRTILNKRSITREMLFQYLHRHKISVDFNITKADLITRVLEYWHKIGNEKNSEQEQTEEHLLRTEAKSSQKNSLDVDEIHPLSIQFVKWFFDRYNQRVIVPEDFFADASLTLRLLSDNGSCLEYFEKNNFELAVRLSATKSQYNLFFNPNLTASGVHGKMDPHGLLVVTCSGTLHVVDRCIGIFEAMFGLTRDPFVGNNWKAKIVKILCKSSSSSKPPSADNSELKNLSL